MIEFVRFKALSGFNYIRADQVIAVREAEGGRGSMVFLAGGATIPCNEPAQDVIAKLEAPSKAAPVQQNPSPESPPHGDATE